MADEVQASMEFLDMSEDAQQMSYESWASNITLLSDGEHEVKIIKDGNVQPRNVSVTRSLDTMEVNYIDGDWTYAVVIKPNGRMYTTKTYKGNDVGIPSSISTKGMWRFL